MLAILLLLLLEDSYSSVFFCSKYSPQFPLLDLAHFLQIFFIGRTHSEIFLEALKNVLAQFSIQSTGSRTRQVRAQISAQPPIVYSLGHTT